MSNLITLNVTGRLGRDPQLKSTSSGTAVLNFAMASSRSVKKDGEYDNETVWFDIAVWGARAEGLAKALGKGDLVSVAGTFWPRTYRRKDGTEGTAYEVQAHTVNREMLAPARAEQAKEHVRRNYGRDRDDDDAGPGDDDIPF